MTNSPSTVPLSSLERRYLPKMREMPGNVYSPGRMFALLDVKRRTTRNRERKRERERERGGGMACG
jgi:hypothetical protein